MAVGVYVRVSTEEQRERQSIVTQREFAGRYCDLHALPIHETYADDGVSGTVPLELRAAGKRLLEDARAAQVRPAARLQAGPPRPRHPPDPECRRRTGEARSPRAAA